MLSLEKKSKARGGGECRFAHMGDTFPIGTTGLLCEKLRFVRGLYQNLPQIGQFFYHGIYMPCHDTMPTFMNFRRVSDLRGFKKQDSQCLKPSQDAEMFVIHSHFLHGTKTCTQGHMYGFEAILVHWSMCL
jgi:hypothetical protein